MTGSQQLQKVNLTAAHTLGKQPSETRLANWLGFVFSLRFIALVSTAYHVPLTLFYQHQDTMMTRGSVPATS